MNPAWLRFQAEHSRLTLQIHAQPNAKSTGAAGLHGDALKVRIAAPAVDDKANAVNILCADIFNDGILFSVIGVQV